MEPTTSCRHAVGAACACRTRIRVEAPALLGVKSLSKSRGRVRPRLDSLPASSQRRPQRRVPGPKGRSSGLWRTLARSAFERPLAGGRDPDAPDFDRLSACADRLPPHYHESLAHKDGEHCERKPTGQHDRLSDAVYTGTAEQGESAALLHTKAR
jgi:hypothetical protein